MEEYRFCPLCAAPLAPLPAGHRDAGRPACPIGHFVHYANPAVTTYAFVGGANGRFLALRRAHPPAAGGWDLPGGFVEAGEAPADCVRREIGEAAWFTLDEFPTPAFAGERAGLADLAASRPPWTSPSPTSNS